MSLGLAPLDIHMRLPDHAVGSAHGALRPRMTEGIQPPAIPSEQLPLRYARAWIRSTLMRSEGFRLLPASRICRDFSRKYLASPQRGSDQEYLLV